MSKNITVSEGNTARVFGNTKKLETKLQGEDAGSCYWVPEDETEAQSLYITENGMHEAAEEKLYGYSDVHVNIPAQTTDEEGIEWDISIDDEGIPHITIDDPDSPYTGTDISIDDVTGDIDVHIPGKDPDDWPGWDDLDPAIKDDFDAWIEELQEPDDWPGWDDLDPETKTDFDEWTEDTDTKIDPEEAGLDPEKDVDTSFDPDDQDVSMVGTDGDGNESVVDYNPETGETSKELCPASIKILQEPTNTQYTHGQAIDYSGIIVQAFDANGKRMTGRFYPDGNIPLSSLKFSQNYADYTNGAPTVEAPPYSDDVTINGNGSVTQLVDFLAAGMRKQLNELVLDTERLEYRTSYDESLQSVLSELSGFNVNNCIVSMANPTFGPGSSGIMVNCLHVYIFDNLPAHPIKGQQYAYTLHRWSYRWDYTGNNGYNHHEILSGHRTVFQGAKDGEVSTINMFTGEDRSNKIMVFWEGPCYTEFADIFNITVVESVYGGATGGGGGTSGGGAGRG